MKAGWKIMVLIGALLVCGPRLNAEEQYKKYDATSREKVLLEIAVTAEEWVFAIYADSQEQVYTIPATDISIREGTVHCGPDIALDAGGLEFPGYFIPNDRIRRISLEPGETADKTKLIFWGGDQAQTGDRLRRKKSDIVSFSENVTVAKDDFVRGSVIAFFGDVSVYGEVNEDVVAVSGDVFVGNEAVIRGDVVSVRGKVEISGNASVYGAIKSTKGKTSPRHYGAKRWKAQRSTVATTGAVYYNRVDGATLWGGLEYEHADSIIPSCEALAGYGFASGRWRYRVGLTQTLLRGRVPVQLGGKLFRELKSDDDKIISEAENSYFALLVNEDWKDYYESEGAYGFARVTALGWNTFEVGYLSETQRWLDAHPRLWSLFDDKDFRGNFSSVPYDTLRYIKKAFSDREISSLLLQYTLDTRDDEKRPRQGWYGFARYEYSPGDWTGDFDFKRFETQLKRYQPLGRYVSAYLTGAYGYSSGTDIPLSRLFYLGGLGTLHGYRHKSLIGREYAFVSGEYRFRIPRSEVAPFVMYDVGKILSGRMTGEDSWYNSIGVGVDIDRSVRLFISRRLDRSEADPVIYARFAAIM